MSKWREYTIEEVAQIFDGPHATPEKVAVGPWFLSISSLNNGRLNLGESAHISEDDFARWTRRVTPTEGDVLFSYETRLGEAALMPRGITACLGRRMALLRARQGVVDPQFLLYAYLGPEFQRTIHERKIAGATVDRIPLAEMGSWPLSLPALDEQKAIATILRALDDKIAINERIVATALELADANFSRIEVASEVTLEDLVRRGELTFGDGYRTKRAEHGQPGIPILRVSDIQHGQICPAPTDYVSVEFRPQMGPKVSQAGDVVLTTKGTVGRVALVPDSMGEYVYSPQVCFFRPSSTGAVGSHFVFLWMRSREFAAQVEPLKSQTDMADYISLSDIRRLRIGLPRELRQLSEVTKPLLQRIEVAQREFRALAHIRDTLLPRLMSGHITIRAAESLVGDAT